MKICRNKWSAFDKAMEARRFLPTNFKSQTVVRVSNLETHWEVKKKILIFPSGTKRM